MTLEFEPTTEVYSSDREPSQVITRPWGFPIKHLYVLRCLCQKVNRREKKWFERVDGMGSWVDWWWSCLFLSRTWLSNYMQHFFVQKNSFFSKQQQQQTTTTNNSNSNNNDNNQMLVNFFVVQTTLQFANTCNFNNLIKNSIYVDSLWYTNLDLHFPTTDF